MKTLVKLACVLDIAATVAFSATSALAASNSAVDNIKVGGVNAPKCVQFWTADNDGVAYGVSTRDTQYQVAVMLLTASNFSTFPGSTVLPLIFSTTTVTDGTDFHPSDCPSPVVYVHAISEGQ